tara:strand:+ start:333 stop:998 length:666 start_codon:yes stop_codon:yes gene_type:complete
MKSIQTAIIYISLINISISQNINEIDSVQMRICESVKLNSNLDDNKLIELINENHISKYLATKNNVNKDSLLDHVLLRTEKLCPEYSALAYRINDNFGDWVLLDHKPTTNIGHALCDEFFKVESFYYLEPNGNKVELEIKDEFWIDRFIDNTYSKLGLKIKSSCDFTIQFIESNNSMRNKFSKTGDEYNYQILDYVNERYYMAVEISGQEQYYKFILYPNK